MLEIVAVNVSVDLAASIFSLYVHIVHIRSSFSLLPSSLLR